MNTKLLSLLILLFFPLTFFAQSNIVGDWKAEITAENGEKRVMKLTIKADNTYSLDMAMDGEINVNGNYQLSDDMRMTINDINGEYACPPEATGVYDITIEGDKLSMKYVSDECEGRGNPDGAMEFTRM